MVWSVSQRLAGRVHQGKTQVRSRTAVSLGVPVRDHVGVDRVVGFEVQDRLHDHLAGRAAPVADLAGGDQLVALLEPGGADAFEGCPGEVDVEDDLSLRVGWFRDGRGAPSSTTVNSLRSRASWWRASSPTAAARRTLRESSEPRSFSWAANAGDGLFEVQGVGQVELAVHGAGAGVGDLLLLDREVPAVRLRQPAFLGQLGHERRDRLVHQPFQLDGSDPVRHRRDVPVHKRRRLRVRGGGSGRRSAGPATAAVTVDHRATPAGAGGTSSRAWPTYRLPASVETPIAAANSVIANSATNGAPSPATGIPVSPYRPSADRRGVHDRVDRVHRRPLHRQRCSRSASARSAIRPTARAAANTAPAVSSSCGVLGHGSTQAPTTDTPRPENPLFDRDVENYLRNSFDRNHSGRR